MNAAEPKHTFSAPWEARAFAMVRSLRDGGVLTADEWTSALRTQIGDDPVEVGYEHWLAALEDLLEAKGLVTEVALVRYRTAWARAAGRTRHGEPITLTANDFPA